MRRQPRKQHLGIARRGCLVRQDRRLHRHLETNPGARTPRLAILLEIDSDREFGRRGKRVYTFRSCGYLCHIQHLTERLKKTRGQVDSNGLSAVTSAVMLVIVLASRYTQWTPPNHKRARSILLRSAVQLTATPSERGEMKR